MTPHVKFKGLPWLVLEGQVIDLMGWGRNTLAKMADCGTLHLVKPPGCAQHRFRKIQLATILGVSLEAELEEFRREPLMMSEKATLRHTGYARNTLREIVSAGGLRVIRPAGLTNGRYRKTEIAQLLGLEQCL